MKRVHRTVRIFGPLDRLINDEADKRGVPKGQVINERIFKGYYGKLKNLGTELAKMEKAK